ncbi:unnamed protein product [Parascedosporium putredinis]|uniref:Uncharacterized protein n=1 Tax=Parascedosporium putredinis TaxID=1442378 RepID=A0A9P1M675_9PEZI|nr:unnamed protein product [Parascedosporium putredinis]CAI7988090.1 unnamed protein product [Parascedosporium putredinis]
MIPDLATFASPTFQTTATIDCVTAKESLSAVFGSFSTVTATSDPIQSSIKLHHSPHRPFSTSDSATANRPTFGVQRKHLHQSHDLLERPATASSVHTIRRTPRFEASPSPRPELDRAPKLDNEFDPVKSDVRLAPSPEIFPKPPKGPLPRAPGQAKAKKQRRLARKLSQELSEEDDDESSVRSSSRLRQPQTSKSSDSYVPHPLLQISKRTHRAILFTLEEALRGPYSFTPDITEELAEMADLRGGHEPPTSNGNVSAQARPAHPSATGSPSGIRSPRMILRDRNAREAARRAEQEQIQMERTRMEQEQLRLQQARAEDEARALEEAQRRNVERRVTSTAATAAGGSRHQTGGPGQRPLRRHDRPTTPDRGALRVPQGVSQPSQGRPSRTTGASGHAQQSSYPTPGAGTSGGPLTRGAASATNIKTQPSQQQSQSQQQPRTSFPHAFERWETLSAQWEGLTSHWIRRLELNSSAIESDPVSQQLSRQVTDLSAAGANLFHAVVELQRLRASSERKFQRWFFETRTDLERSHEENAMLTSQIEELRNQLNDARSRTHERDSANSIVQKQLSEMKKELSISKEEARRAWEELGRREQAEREHTLSLQAGQPTIVGGVQVVPMIQGGGISRRPPAQPITTSAPESYYRTAAADAPRPTAGYGQHGSEGGYSEEDYDPATAQAGSYAVATSGDSQWAAAYAPQTDYTGAGYGSGWEAMPRHHHPTRLSDVLEEEESRTSASQVSRP